MTGIVLQRRNIHIVSGCLYSKEISGSVLFDYLNEAIHDTIIEEAIAVYDEIIFDNYDYLAVRDGDTYFYIDLQGKKWNCTGDVGYIDENGNLFVEGRTTDFSIINGKTGSSWHRGYCGRG